MGGGWHCNYSYKLQGPGGILRVDLELNLTVDLERVRPGPELVNKTDSYHMAKNDNAWTRSLSRIIFRIP